MTTNNPLPPLVPMPAPAASVKHPGGRPTDFTPELGEKILELMGVEGLSLAAAAADLNIHRQRVYDWEAKHPEFADTIKLARSKRQLFLERRLLTAETGPVVNSTMFALKNAGQGDWRDRQEVDHQSSDGSMTPQKIEIVPVPGDDGKA